MQAGCNSYYLEKQAGCVGRAQQMQQQGGQAGCLGTGSRQGAAAGSASVGHSKYSGREQGKTQSGCSCGAHRRSAVGAEEWCVGRGCRWELVHSELVVRSQIFVTNST